MVGAATGAVAGLVAITPAAGFVTPAASVIIGLGVGVALLRRLLLRPRSRVDDALDVFAVHGVGGALGRHCDRHLRHNRHQLGRRRRPPRRQSAQLLTQAFGVAVVGAYSAVATAGILFVVNLVTPIRVAGDVEETGLDLAQHGEIAYQP